MAREVKFRSEYPQLAMGGASALLLGAGVAIGTWYHTVGYISTGAGVFLALLLVLWVATDA